MILCPQCGSKFCGDYRCRFSGMTHKLFKENRYAEAMIQKDRFRHLEDNRETDQTGDGRYLYPLTERKR